MSEENTQTVKAREAFLTTKEAIVYSGSSAGTDARTTEALIKARLADAGLYNPKHDRPFDLEQ
jgi:hypothetical protein